MQQRRFKRQRGVRGPRRRTRDLHARPRPCGGRPAYEKRAKRQRGARGPGRRARGLHARPRPCGGRPACEKRGKRARLCREPNPRRNEPSPQQESERPCARPQPVDASDGAIANADGGNDGRPCRERRRASRQAERQQRNPPQEPHQAPARDFEPIDQLLKHDPAGVTLFGKLVMREPSLMLAEVVGHSGHERFRPGNVGFRGRDGVERLNCSRHRACSLERGAGDMRCLPAP